MYLKCDQTLNLSVFLLCFIKKNTSYDRSEKTSQSFDNRLAVYMFTK